MARLTIPDEETIATFTVTTPTTVFPFDFAIFEKADLVVTVDNVVRSQATYTLTGTLLEGGGYQGGTVTLNTSVDDVTVVVYRDVTPARAEGFGAVTSVPVRTVDQALNRQMAVSQDLARDQSALLTNLALLEGLDASVASITEKMTRTGTNADAAILTNLPYVADVTGPATRTAAAKLSETLSIGDFAGTGAAQFTAAFAEIGDRGAPLNLPAGAVVNLATAPTSGVQTIIANGPFTRTGSYTGAIAGGKIVFPAGSGLLFDPFYIGQYPSVDGTFPFEEAFLAFGAAGPTDYRSLSSCFFGVASPTGTNAACFTTRTSDPGGSVASAYALNGYVLNDKTTGALHGGWAAHLIGVRNGNAGTTFGAEIGVCNTGTVQTRQPYNAYAEGLTCAVWAASGFEIPGANAITAYYGMVFNGAAAQTGILVTANALADRGDGYGEVLSVPEKTYIAQKVAADGSTTGSIGFQLSMNVTSVPDAFTMTATNAGLQFLSRSDGRNWMFLNRTDLVFGDAATPWLTSSAAGTVIRGATSIGGAAGNEGLRVLRDAAAVSRVEIYGATVGNPSGLRANGAATDIDIAIQAKGAGRIWLGPVTANADAAITGYMVVKDAAGVDRKLAIIA